MASGGDRPCEGADTASAGHMVATRSVEDNQAVLHQVVQSAVDRAILDFVPGHREPLTDTAATQD